MIFVMESLYGQNATVLNQGSDRVEYFFQLEYRMDRELMYYNM